MAQLVFDACSLINLMATRRSLEMLEALDLEVVVVDRTLAEANFLRVPGPPPPLGWRRERIDYEQLRSASRLVVVAASAVSAPERVRFAADLEDEDALPVAVAVDLELPLASDDKRVRDVATTLAPTLRLRSTFGLVRAAYGACGWTPEILRQVVQDLVDRAAFAAPRWDPNAAEVRALASKER